MPYRNLEPLSKQFTIVIGLTVVGFMAFGLALSFYRNVLFEQRLKNIEANNDALTQEIAKNQSDLEYFHSTQYKDKYAKENLGRLNPGEKLLIITQERSLPILDAEGTLQPSEAQEALYQEHLREIPVYLHWELYLFEREKIDQLKKSL